MKRGFKKQKHEFFLNTIGTGVDFRCNVGALGKNYRKLRGKSIEEDE